MDADVVVLGAGLAGTTLANVLKKHGISTIVIDKQAVYPDAFRAEKIEFDQAEQMRKLGVFEFRIPEMEPIGETVNYCAGSNSEFNTIEQYGLRYGDFVNNLRKHVLHDMDFRIANITGLETSDDQQSVQLMDGSSISCRLVVIATGGMSSLVSGLKYRKKANSSLRTYNVGFYIEPREKDSFEFAGFNYFLDPPKDGVDYLTLFKIEDSMRVNLFTQLKRKDKNAVAFKNNTLEEIDRHFPDLVSQIGKFDITSKIQVFFTDFYRLKNLGQPGVVMIADEYQSVCPATGTGLTKVCNDVDILGNVYIPAWLKKMQFGPNQLNEYYMDQKKWACDQESLYQWIYYRNNAYSFWNKQWSKVDTRMRTLLKAW